MPVVAVSVTAFLPKVAIEDTEACTVAGNCTDLASMPDGMTATNVVVAVDCDVFCSEAGQSAKPVDMHLTPV